MKKHIINLFFLAWLIGGFFSVSASRMVAQTLTILYSFTNNPDGGESLAGLILLSNTLYGTTSKGGSYADDGTVFAIRTNGTGYTTLYNFGSGDGITPQDKLTASGNTLFGTTYSGYFDGVVFKINTNGTGFTNIVSLGVGNNGTANPHAGVILSGGTLYGVGSDGGSFGNGTVFKVNTDGTGFTNLYIFTAFGPRSTNKDGAYPYGDLILSSNILYGTTYWGGSSGIGSVFRLSIDGTGFTNLHSFAGYPSDGANPYAGLTLSGSTLYGTTYYGGSYPGLGYGLGTVFKINTDGTGFTILHSFAGSPDDGATPYSGLYLSDNLLYGTTVGGGNSGNGTIFAINTTGTGFTILYKFTERSGATNSDGAWPYGGVMLSGDTLYGTTTLGGSFGRGTIFALELPVPPSIKITTATNKIILSWPTNATGFILQSVANLSSGSWTNVTSGIITFGTNYVFTNSINGNASFFRLRQ